MRWLPLYLLAGFLSAMYFTERPPDQEIECNTFSIVARDPVTGDLAVTKPFCARSGAACDVEAACKDSVLGITRSF